MGTTNKTSLIDTYQTYFSKQLLKHAVQELHLNEFALQAELPQKSGSDTIRFFRPSEADASQVQTLSEGVVPGNFRNVTYTYIDVPLVQYGEVAKITDVVTMTALFDALTQSIKTMGEDCALHADTITRDVLAHPTAGLTKRYAQGLANFAALDTATPSAGKITAADLLDACTRLKVNRAPRKEGRYVAIVPPQVGRDIQRDPDWIDAAKYSNVQALYKGELGMLYGVRIIEATNPFIESTVEGTYDPAGDIYLTIVTGEGAYGTPKLAGTQSPSKPKIMIVNKPDSANPLNQWMTAGWKAYWAAKVLNPNYGIALRTKSEFAA
ncbi:MAG: N4-gp56 family major capsid protein [Verrucomicrobia bacterium]|nr:MAG: N4-gp56 family major capsid protein [Verrucomicrobiota bacterium]